MIGEEKTKRIEEYLSDFEQKKTDREIRCVVLDKFTEERIEYTIYYSVGLPMALRHSHAECKDIYNILLEK